MKNPNMLGSCSSGDRSRKKLKIEDNIKTQGYLMSSYSSNKSSNERPLENVKIGKLGSSFRSKDNNNDTLGVTQVMIETSLGPPIIPSDPKMPLTNKFDDQDLSEKSESISSADFCREQSISSISSSKNIRKSSNSGMGSSKVAQTKMQKKSSRDKSSPHPKKQKGKKSSSKPRVKDRFKRISTKKRSKEKTKIKDIRETNLPGQYMIKIGNLKTESDNSPTRIGIPQDALSDNPNITINLPNPRLENKRGSVVQHQHPGQFYDTHKSTLAPFDPNKSEGSLEEEDFKSQTIFLQPLDDIGNTCVQEDSDESNISMSKSDNKRSGSSDPEKSVFSSNERRLISPNKLYGDKKFFKNESRHNERGHNKECKTSKFQKLYQRLKLHKMIEDQKRKVERIKCRIPGKIRKEFNYEQFMLPQSRRTSARSIRLFENKNPKDTFYKKNHKRILARNNRTVRIKRRDNHQKTVLAMSPRTSKAKIKSSKRDFSEENPKFVKRLLSRYEKSRNNTVRKFETEALDFMMKNLDTVDHQCEQDEHKNIIRDRFRTFLNPMKKIKERSYKNSIYKKIKDNQIFKDLKVTSDIIRFKSPDPKLKTLISSVIPSRDAHNKSPTKQSSNKKIRRSIPKKNHKTVRFGPTKNPRTPFDKLSKFT
ncbi:unnamed protein product [Moneuplotes crassus]|uniref:Uncharacterized protein n=1 Tax=Euplotes crassus TaxID=5936 RepID=A0AAD2D0N4_EUPCR|nr:unnamed protein product [Moneuplotes crassus]